MSMKYSKLLIIALIIIAAIPMVQAQSDLNGTLKRNNFTSSKWNQSSSNLVFNLTSNRVYLDQYNVSGGSYENLTAYTEYEESLDYITDRNETHVRAKCDLQYGRYLVYDYGADYFNDFTIRFALKLNGIWSTGLNDHYYFSLNNQTLGDRSDYTNGDNFYDFRINNDNTGDDWRIAISSLSNGESFFSGWTEDNTLDDDWLYIQIKKIGGSINCTVYDNSDFTGLHWSYNLTHTDTPTYRYIYPVQSLDLNLYPTFYLDVWVKEVDLGKSSLAYYPSGELITVDLLANETSKTAYSILYKAVTGTTAKLEAWFSEDNGNWTSISQRGLLIESYNYSSLYLKFRLNSTTGIDTPYLDYYHLFYKESEVTASEESGLTFGDIYWYVLAIWIVLNVLGRMKKEKGGNTKVLLIMAAVIGMITAIMLLSIDQNLFGYLFFVLNIIMLLEAASSK